MSIPVINRSGVDQVTAEFIQTGRGETSCTLNTDLLDGEKQYHFCVDSWNIPLNNTPMNKYRGKTLFTIFRRNVGQTLELLSHVAVPAGGVVGMSYVLQQDFLDVQSLVAALNNFARGFQALFEEPGIPDLRLYGGLHDAASAADAIALPLQQIGPDNDEFWLNFSLDIDGRLSLLATTNFINNFVIRFERIGAEILSLSTHLLTATHGILSEDVAGVYLTPARPYLYFAPTNDDLRNADFLGPGNIIQAGGNVREKLIRGQRSLYSTFDCRLKCTLDSHLPSPSNVFIEDGKQKNSRHICEVFFDKVLTTTFNVSDSELEISSKCYSGQYPIVKKSDVYKQWHKLTNAYGLRFFRFYNFITYREFDTARNSWVFKKYPLEVDENNYVDFSLRFISEA